MVKIAIIDDQVILRESLKLILEQDQDITVVGCGGNGFEALTICDRELPDVVLMDMVMPECDGILGTKLIKDKYPMVRILVLTTFNEEEQVQKVLENGADGYVLKDICPDELILAIKGVKQGLGVIHHDAYHTILKRFDQPLPLKKEENTQEFDLGERELKLLSLIVDGKNNKEIAKDLFIAEGTVKNMVSALLTKLNSKDRTQLAVFAIVNNLV